VDGYRSAANRQQYDVAPDGKGFLMIREPKGTRNRELVYAQGWFTELLSKTKP